jgi:hypothetical protein
VDIFANKKVSITLIESLPKEKTQVLGYTECILGSTFLNYPQRDPDENSDVPLTPPPLHFKTSVPISYLNPKLLPNPPKEGEPNNQPELTIEASISNLLIPMDVVEAGNFVTVKLDDAFPVPDEWALREGNEKDVNSSELIIMKRFRVFFRLH